MAIKITNGTGTRLHDTNSFYNVESSNLSYVSKTSANGATLNVARYISLNFATGGTFKGVMLAFQSTAAIDRSATITLQENVSGTWTDRSSQTISWADMTANITAPYNYVGMYWINFNNFDTAITVDTTTDKRRLKCIQTGGTTGNLVMIRGQDSSTPHYAAYCDNLSNFVDGDTPIIAHPTEIGASATFNSVLGIGDTTYGVACIICSNMVDASVDNVSLLTVLNPTASYTLTLNGIMLINGHSGFRVGTSANTIPIANRFNILLNTATVGTAKGSIRSHTNGYSASYYYSSRPSLFLYGEIGITKQRGELAIDAEIGANTLTMTEDMSTYGWANGDIISIGKQDVIGQGSLTTYTISSISGTTITLTTTIATYKRFSGGSVINMTENNYGISFKSNNTTVAGNIISTVNNLNIEGTYIWNTYLSGNTVYYYAYDDDINITKMTFKNNCVISTTTSIYYFLYNNRVNTKGLEVDNNIGYRSLPFYSATQYKTSLYKSGIITVKNIRILSKYNGYMALGGQSIKEVDNIFIENGYTNYNIIFGGFGASYSNIHTRGLSGGITYGSLYIGGVGCNYSNITADSCDIGVISINSILDIDNTYINVNLGIEKDNIYDYYINDGAYIKSVFKECKGRDVAYNTDLTGTTQGTMMKFVNYEDISNNDKVLTTYGNFQRTGDGLTDTTVHTSGTGKFAIRLEPLFSGSPLILESDIPTGDIQNKQIGFGVRCKINSANYYSGVYQMPRLIISYDDKTNIAYSEAIQTTDRQYIYIIVTPTTSFGQIHIGLSADTDLIGTDSYVYFDDFSTFYPPGINISLGGMDLFADALPITPYITTNINASDIWSYPTSSISTTGSIGVLIKKIYTFILSLL